MGKKDTSKKEEVAAPTNDKEEEEEDTPVIKALKAIDDKYCTAEMECEREVEKLRKKYAERQKPILEERSKFLLEGDDGSSGTPGCPGFWFTAFDNAGQLEELLEDQDEKALMSLKDVKVSQVDPDCEKKGFRVEFFFAENEFFTNESLWVESHYDYDVETAKPWKEPDCIEVKCSTIDWKAGKNLTVTKSKDGGAAKKGKKKPAKAKEVPCASFFRTIFTPLKASDDDLPEDLMCVYEGMGDCEDEDMLEMHLMNVGETLSFLAQELVPYAVRYYTGEACESDDDDEEGEEESSVEDSDEESDEAPAPKKGGKKSPQMKAKAAPGKDGKTEECKQQ
jgi:nucleosome assembly protein 1-like 1